MLPAFDRAGHAALIDRLIATWTPARLRAGCAAASDSDRPLLIVGMMRSGTTLLEQMLAAHPRVAAGGELSFWGGAGGSGEAPPADAAAAALVGFYLAELAAIAPEARHVTDKLPHNVYALGLVHLLFPRARILHCRRDAADIGLSLYRTLFAAPHGFAYDKGDIVFVCANTSGWRRTGARCCRPGRCWKCPTRRWSPSRKRRCARCSGSAGCRGTRAASTMPRTAA